MSDYSFKIEEIQNPTIDPAVPNPYGAKSYTYNTKGKCT